MLQINCCDVVIILELDGVFYFKWEMLLPETNPVQK